MKRGTDHVWEAVKYNGDLAIYAKCSCGYSYNASLEERGENGWMFPQKIDPNKLFRYCPCCGARKIRYIPDIKMLDEFSSRQLFYY